VRCDKVAQGSGVLLVTVDMKTAAGR
jgi:hypothetical protein